VFRKSLLLFCAGLLAFNVAKADAVFQDSQHNSVSLATLSGKWVIVSYWASWCGACAEETPQLNHLYETNRQDDVVMYGVDFDQQSPEDTIAAAQKMEIKYPVLFGDPRIAWSLGAVTLLPTTFIINPEGKVVERILGSHDEAYIWGRVVALKK
jgi:thiol-disulfide isomerase/thioredoxin